MNGKKARLKEVELRLISELMKNSRRSDRALARALCISQPTVSRIIKKLEKDGVIKEYTVIPDFAKLGYGLLGVILIRVKNREKPEDAERSRAAISEDMNKKVFPDLLMKRGMGLGFEGIIMTLHRSYSDYEEQINYTKTRPFVQADHVDSFLVDLTDPVQYRDLTLSLVADDLISRTEKKDTLEEREVAANVKSRSG